MGREEQSDPEGISAAVTAAGEHDDGETFKFEKKTFKKEEKKWSNHDRTNLNKTPLGGGK